MANVQLAVAGDETTQVILSVPGVQGPTGSSIPPSGTTHQLLYKQSNTDYDTAWKLITNDNVDAAAAIAGTKISPNFGSQNMLTTGTSTAASFIPSSSSVPTNGLYLPAANSVALSTNGDGKLFIDSAGKVTVKGAGTAAFVVEGSAPNNSLVIKDTTGNVGIGTSSPSTFGAQLAVIGGSVHADRTIGGGAAQVQFSMGASSGANFGQIGNTGTRWSLGYGATANTIGTEVLVWNSSGRVGIGTTSPSFLLDLFGTTPALRIKANGVSNGIKLEQSSATGDVELNVIDVYPLVFKTSNTERARIDSSGRFLVGTSSARSNFYNSSVTAKSQIEYSDATFTAGLSCVYNLAGSSGSEIVLGKTRSSSIGGNTLVAADDTTGVISFQGADGSELVECATIRAQVDGTPGADDMPGRLVFSVTADGASSPTEAMRIKNSRILNFANTPTYADNTAAKAGGLVDGDVYRKSDGTLMIVYT